MTDAIGDAELERLRLDLENVRAELDSFACSVSHDLRDPLRAINDFGDLLAGRIRADAEPGKGAAFSFSLPRPAAS